MLWSEPVQRTGRPVGHRTIKIQLNGISNEFATTTFCTHFVCRTRIDTIWNNSFLRSRNQLSPSDKCTAIINVPIRNQIIKSETSRHTARANWRNIVILSVRVSFFHSFRFIAMAATASLPFVLVLHFTFASIPPISLCVRSSVCVSVHLIAVLFCREKKRTRNNCYNYVNKIFSSWVERAIRFALAMPSRPFEQAVAWQSRAATSVLCMQCTSFPIVSHIFLPDFSCLLLLLLPSSFVW